MKFRFVIKEVGYAKKISWRKEDARYQMPDTGYLFRGIGYLASCIFLAYTIFKHLFLPPINFNPKLAV